MSVESKLDALIGVIAKQVDQNQALIEQNKTLLEKMDSAGRRKVENPNIGDMTRDLEEAGEWNARVHAKDVPDPDATIKRLINAQAKTLFQVQESKRRKGTGGDGIKVVLSKNVKAGIAAPGE